MTDEELFESVREEVKNWFANRAAARKAKKMEPKPIDPVKLKFFIKMNEDTKCKVLSKLKSNYDRSLSKSYQKKKRGGSLSSYLVSGLNAEEQAFAALPLEEQVKVNQFMEETSLTLQQAIGSADPPPSEKTILAK